MAAILSANAVLNDAMTHSHMAGDRVVPRISAINRFQASMNLPVTGYPDTQTLFLLCHQDGL